MRSYISNFLAFPTAVLAFGLNGCATDSETTRDLPSGWQDAERVTDLVQVECVDSALDSANETATFEPGIDSLKVDYREAHFRCEQAVEGFYKVEGRALDILVQPVEMHPSAVAGCDCLYGITFSIKPLSTDAVQATLYRRWDDWNEPNNPVKIASELVTLE
jgi:hypothetical protein